MVNGMSAEQRLVFLETLDALDALAGDWPVTCAEGLPTQSFAWVRACAEAFADPGGLRIVALSSNGRLQAVAPLHVAGRLRGTTLLGRELWEPADFIYRDAAGLAALTGAVARRREALVISRMPGDAGTVQALRDAYRHRGLVLVRDAGQTPIAVLPPDGVAPETLLNSGRQSDLRRALRRAEGLGSVRFEVLSPAPSEVEPLLEEFFAVEAANWKARTGTALALDPLRGRFFRLLAARAAGDGILRFAFMRIDGRPVAAQYGLEWNRRLWLLKIGYDEEFARCSPGQLLMLESLRQAAAWKLDAVEFLGEAADWTRMWTRDARPCIALRIYPIGASGAKAVCSDGAWVVRRRAVDPVVRRAVSHYLAGRDIGDVVAVARVLADADQGCTIGYWDSGDETPRDVAVALLAVVEALEANRIDGYVSAKAPALGFSDRLAREIAEACRAGSVRLHFDSLAPQDADRTFALIGSLEGLAALGCTLPGRWRRSTADADWAVERGLFVRVVKGEWPDTDAPKRDERGGFLEVIDWLAGRARHVAVATHDGPLAREALSRLRDAGTSCELELLYRRRQIEIDGWAPRIYLPFGHPWAPYPIRQAPWRPRIAWQFARDVVAGGRGSPPRRPVPSSRHYSRSPERAALVSASRLFATPIRE